MKKVFCVTSSCILLATVISSCSIGTKKAYYSEDKIKGDIPSYVGHGLLSKSDIEIKKRLEIGEVKYILFEANKKIGDAEVIHGINANGDEYYSLDSVGYNNNYFFSTVVSNKSDKYIIVEGKNFDKKIAYIECTLDNVEYKIHIPKEDYFIESAKINGQIDASDKNCNNIKFYDDNDIDITNNVSKELFKE
ncbi:hypothetical protein [Clostridium manihotivorum]|uniref:Lipoprotein n=1 Tax=Clostridium manihotivorum TaxID=2320868 RepID=A0A410DXP0_9CLOT|nr:hypothetical protein [Clostridium manihotivorum]QAA33692.1 hypothetical protein C1I91_19780 [Clostridium manihotivorum]